MRRRAALLAGAVLLLLATIAAGVCIGETPIHPRVVFAAISNKLFGTEYPVAPIQAGIVWNYRLTRIIVAACCGAALAVCGAVLQALLRNALADPYLLGISSGASAGAVSVLVLGLGAGLLSLSVGAFAGALIAFGLVALLARAAGGGVGLQATGLIILSGIAGSQLFNALTSFIIARSANAEQARSVMFWLMGNMSGVRWPDVGLAVPVAIVGILVCVWHMRALDAFTFGSDSAASLGVPVRRVQAVLIGTTSMMTAAMVSMVGAIGFVGLVIPHAARFVVGVRHARLLPASALTGAIFLVAADVVSRIIIPNQVLPIGVITALVGAPGFAVILLRARRTR
jgi:iron complex transport system permease protein